MIISPINLSPRDKLLKVIFWLMIPVALLAVASLILQYGGYVNEADQRFLHYIDLGIVFAFIGQAIAKLALTHNRREHFRKNLVDFVLIGLLALELIIVKSLGDVSFLVMFREFIAKHLLLSTTKLWIIVTQLYIISVLIIKGIRLQTLLAHSRQRPARVLVLSFLIAIILGSILLCSPHASREEPLQPIDALFTATSAVCVTGLIVKDTGAQFSTFGHLTILGLIQLGGLGLMTFGCFIALITGRGLGLREQVLMQDVLNYKLLGRVSRLIAAILLFTLFMEVIGVALLFGQWEESDLVYGGRLYYSIFHSVSGFCNAGFSLISSSLRGYYNHPGILGIMMTLIILGGLGFVVLYEVSVFLRTILFRKRPRIGLRRTPLFQAPPGTVSLHSKVVLITTALLLVLGLLLFFVVEYKGTLSEMTFAEKATNALFQSVTTRTAGFNTIDQSQLSGASKELSVFLMFIGASPGSTGGGIKTATVAILFLAVICTLRGRRRIEVFKRTVDYALLRRALAVLCLSVLFVFAAVFILSLSEADSGRSFNDLFFEVISAFATVGLSTGVTAELSLIGKLVIIVSMFCGRIGPITVILSLAEGRRSAKYEYPTEQVMIG